jgi:hypothetical protein
MNPRAFLTGARAAFVAPAWLGADRLRLLMAPADAPAPSYPEPEQAMRAARWTLRQLARVPGGRWRATCLYESVAECLVLRGAGIPAAVCIGVRRGTGGSAGTLSAHAWVARSATDRQFHGYQTLDVLPELMRQR